MMAPQTSRAEAIQIAHDEIDAFLSSEASKNNLPAEVNEKAKVFFRQLYEERVKISGRHPNADILLAAIIHVACRQCKGQWRTFKETALLIGTKKKSTLEKYYIHIDRLLSKLNNSEGKKIQSETALYLTPYIHGAHTYAADLAARWSAIIQLSSKGIRLATEPASRIGEWTSRMPSNTAGAAMFAVGRFLGMELLFTKISDTSQTTIVSLMNAYADLYWRKEMYCPMDWLIENDLDLKRLPNLSHVSLKQPVFYVSPTEANEPEVALSSEPKM